MKATAFSSVLVGLVAHLVEVTVEVRPGGGLGNFAIPDLDDVVAREMRVRVRAALASLGHGTPPDATVSVSLKTAGLRLGGLQLSGLDLPILVATMAALELAPRSALSPHDLYIGELSLNGKLRPVRGVLAQLAGAAALGFQRAVIPAGNGGEGAEVSELAVLVAQDALEVSWWLSGTDLPLAVHSGHRTEPIFDMADVSVDPQVRRALEIAAVGGHNVLFVGPPGSGKTMLARRFTGLLPPMTEEETREVSMIHSVAGLMPEGAGRVGLRPFRAPHHTVSLAGLVGGGQGAARPGELSLAHRGVLFLDELPEFRAATLEALKLYLREGAVRISSRDRLSVFPARPIVFGSASLCSCGWRDMGGAGSARCACTPERRAGYVARLASLAVDLFDVVVPLRSMGITAGEGGECSDAIRTRVERARARAGEFDETRVLRVARSIAQLEGASTVLPVHVEEAGALASFKGLR